MNSFSEVYARLRKKNRSQYALLIGCFFFASLMITAYSVMMRSPTVLSILPEGGDSRKQLMLIFLLTAAGCGVFISYASGLFFRYKSRETGIFLALGASKQQLAKELRRELSLMGALSCGLGILLGGPLAWAIWKGFRIFLVDTKEMHLSFDLQCFLIPLAFTAYVLFFLLLMLRRFLRRSNLMDIISETRKSESIRIVPRYYGWLGILLMIAGGILGYFAPVVLIHKLQWYPPESLSMIFYLPVFPGVYLLLLHTVVNGWRRKRNRYRNILSDSMMKFEGRRTVLNMVVVTLLIAGAYFASFYAPVLCTGSMLQFEDQKVDYAFHYRGDQSLPSQKEIRRMAEDRGVTLTRYAEATGSVLAVDGMAHIEENTKVGTVYHKEYREVLCSDVFLSETDYQRLTGETIDIPSGTVATVLSDTGDDGGLVSTKLSVVTNPLTGEKLSVTPAESPLKNSVLFGCRVLDDADYAQVSEGLPPEWQEVRVLFNVKDVWETYEFAKALYYDIVDRSDASVAVFDSWDPVEKIQTEAEGLPYHYDNTYLEENERETIDYSEKDASSFRLYWKYMPQFRVLDKADFTKTMAVYLMLFVFIAILCFAAVCIILFTRCISIILSNARVYEDLRRLGASRRYLYAAMKNQISRVFFVPCLTGTFIISAFYLMILWSNDGFLSSAELAGIGVCGVLILLVSALIWGIYRITLKKSAAALRLQKETR